MAERAGPRNNGRAASGRGARGRIGYPEGADPGIREEMAGRR